MSAPTYDGQVAVYQDTGVANATPRIIYVNGIQTTGDTHASTALALSQITQRSVIGVYNRTAGSDAKGWMFDFLQCGSDWVNGFSNQVGEFGFDAVNAAVNKVRSWTGRSTGTPSDAGQALRDKLSQPKLVDFLRKYLAATNEASASLFLQLHNHVSQRQLIVAHSQGNLVTASALWALQVVHGSRGFSGIQVYSVASPAPAWPAGVNFRIKVYGHTNDAVTLFDPKNLLGRRSAGDWRQHGESSLPGVDAHDIAVNFFGTNFVSRIRSDLGLGEMSDSTGTPQPYLPGDKVHVVNSGESVSAIAQKYLGSVTRWEEVYDRNREVIGPNPNLIQPGMRLVIPA